MLKRVLGVLFLLSVVAVPAFAQTDVIPTPATKLAFDHDGVNTTGYSLVTNGTAANLGMVPVAVAPVQREIPFPALVPGIYTFTVRAYSAAGQSPDSNVLSVRVMVLPITPTNLRLVMTFDEHGVLISTRLV